ncbi:hypothetical protein RHMOL_Rhmol11G0083000 [Rhododendron molle]|uniref:Uncharacterized protein n=1 Tax=Rhododendron molle TaxID=49168 RepID=A0ACC0LPV4_RHOML|nr:hypothetical protein RHMOL_Rhmol11G0083000 [Rhododendron molle]
MGTNINQMNVIVGLLKVKVQTREMVSRHWILQVARDKSMFSTLAGKYGGYVTFRDNNKGKIIYIGTFIRQELSITQFITLQNCGVIQMHLFDINLLGDSSLKETDTFTTGGQPTILDIGMHRLHRQVNLLTHLNVEIAEHNELREKEMPLVQDVEAKVKDFTQF